jgi:hypothetical protein
MVDARTQVGVHQYPGASCGQENGHPVDPTTEETKVVQQLHEKWA